MSIRAVSLVTKACDACSARCHRSRACGSSATPEPARGCRRASSLPNSRHVQFWESAAHPTKRGIGAFADPHSQRHSVKNVQQKRLHFSDNSRGVPMLHKCANPACSVPFLRITEGKLFVVQMPARPAPNTRGYDQKKRALRKVEHYWMCDKCARELTIFFDAERGIVTVPLPGIRKPVLSDVGERTLLGVATGINR